MRGDSTFAPQPGRPARAPITTGPRAGFPGAPAKPPSPARPGNLSYEVQVQMWYRSRLRPRAARSLPTVTASSSRGRRGHGWTRRRHLLRARLRQRLSRRRSAKFCDPTAVGRCLHPYDQLKAAHIADYRHFFDRVSFTLPRTDASAQQTDARIRGYGGGKADPSLAVLYYQMGRYLIFSSGRPDNPLPSNSQGIWGDGLDIPWKCDYKSNINYQMSYSESANLSELRMPAIRFDAALVTPGTKTAQTYFNAPGWAVAYTANAAGGTLGLAYEPPPSRSVATDTQSSTQPSTPASARQVYQAASVR